MEVSGLKCKPTTIKNPQANAILERVHQVIMTMLHTTELDMTNTVVPSNISDFLTDAAWAIALHTTQYLKPLQVQQFLVGTCCLTYLSLPTGTKLGNTGSSKLIAIHSMKTIHIWSGVDDKVLLQNEGIFCISKSRFHCDPWTISTVHMNGTIRIQCGTKSE